MKKIQKDIKLYVGLAALALISSCKPEIDVDSPGKDNQADFSKYIAIGNSLTAGYSDGGLYLEGQKNSFPNMLAEKMKAQGGGEFLTPYFTEAQSNGSGYLRLKALVNGQPVTESVKDKLAIRGISPSGKHLYTKYTTPIHNLGVPGMRLDFAFANGMGSQEGIPYFERLLPDNTALTYKYFDYTTTQNHTFFSFSLGNNDALGYATNGAFDDGTGMNKLTDPTLFATLYSNFITALTANKQKGVIANIPDVTAVPFFSTVTTALLEKGVSAKTNNQFSKIYIRTANGVREATNEDYFPLNFPTDTLGKALVYGNPLTAGYGLVSQNPLHDKFVLDKDEVVEVKNTITAYNKTIAEIASSKGLALADIHSFLNKVKTGYVSNGVLISNKYITGNVFSLDGIHLTPMGYAIMANIFIDAINVKYNSGLEKVDVTKYRGVIMP